MIFEGQGAARGLHAGKPGEWWLHSSGSPFSGQACVGSLSSAGKTLSRSALQLSFSRLHEDHVVLSFLRPYSRKYHQLSCSFLTETTFQPYSSCLIFGYPDLPESLIQRRSLELFLQGVNHLQSC